MIFPTLQFAVFFAVVLPLSWALMPRPRLWKPLMIAASYVFYGSAGAHFVFLLAGCTLWNQAFAILIARAGDRERARSWLLAGAITGDLGLLGWFKYYGFFVANVAAFTSRLGLPMPLPLLQVALPVGISFFTFQAMSYVIDVRRRAYAPVRTLDFALYLSFFPHLIAGPLVRANELAPQFATPRDPRRIEAARAFELIASGLSKKVLLADPIATSLVDPVFGAPALHSRLDVIAAVYGYAVQIYCDFSAYSDMAIGLALLLGFQFPQNFNRPYAAVTLQEFWHRWHMTLSRWLRDYLYIGLGGNRHGRLRTYRNLFLTMLLGGLWHGAAWNFVLWGGIHGLGLEAERWYAERHGKGPIRYPWLRWLLTFNLVCLAWVFFRADNLETVGALARRLVDGGGLTTLTLPIALAIGAGLALHALPRRPATWARVTFARLGPLAQGVALAGVLLVTSAMVTGQGVAPFIYYRFLGVLRDLRRSRLFDHRAGPAADGLAPPRGGHGPGVGRLADHLHRTCANGHRGRPGPGAAAGCPRDRPCRAGHARWPLPHGHARRGAYGAGHERGDAPDLAVGWAVRGAGPRAATGDAAAAGARRRNGDPFRPTGTDYGHARAHS